MNIKSLKKTGPVMFLITFSLISCKKDPEYQVLKGELTGYVHLYDRNNPFIEDHSGVNVILEGHNPEIKTQTNVSGQYMFENLEAGTYNIIFQKEGFCEQRIIGRQFVGGNKPKSNGEIQLYNIPLYRADSLELYEKPTYSELFIGGIARVSNFEEYPNSQFRYFISDTPEVSYRNYFSTGTFSASRQIYFSAIIDTLRFPTGSEIYVVLYPSSEPNQSYRDIESGLSIFTSLNYDIPSNVASITVPRLKDPGYSK